MADVTMALAAASHSRRRTTVSAVNHPGADLTFRSLSGKEPVSSEGVVSKRAAASGLLDVVDVPQELSAAAQQDRDDGAGAADAHSALQRQPPTIQVVPDGGGDVHVRASAAPSVRVEPTPLQAPPEVTAAQTRVASIAAHSPAERLLFDDSSLDGILFTCLPLFGENYPLSKCMSYLVVPFVRPPECLEPSEAEAEHVYWTAASKYLAKLRRERDAGRPVNKMDIAWLELHWKHMELYAT